MFSKFLKIFLYLILEKHLSALTTRPFYIDLRCNISTSKSQLIKLLISNRCNGNLPSLFTDNSFKNISRDIRRKNRYTFRISSISAGFFMPITSLLSTLDSDIENNERDKELIRYLSKTQNLGLMASNYMYNQLSSMSPIIQVFILLVLYTFHLTILTQHHIVLPFQLIPNKNGHFQSFGLDTMMGVLCFISWIFFSPKAPYTIDSFHGKGRSVGPERGILIKLKLCSLWKDPNNFTGEAPWKFPTRRVLITRDINNITDEIKDMPILSKSIRTSIISNFTPRVTSSVALVLLAVSYFLCSKFSEFAELNLYSLAGLGIPLTIAMHRSLSVLVGHLAWVSVGSFILRLCLRPKPFFGGGIDYSDNCGSFSTEILDDNPYCEISRNNKICMYNDDTSVTCYNSDIRKKKSLTYKWYTARWKTCWLWWTLGGYFVSCWMFNVADFVNQILLPPSVFEFSGEGVVSQLINPEHNEIAASLVAYIAPCLSAPWWEEVLYRGFVLPALCLHMKFWPSVLLSGVIFSAHHMSFTSAIPLAVLGWTWAIIYVMSRNLLVTIFIHTMWNSRVFFGSWLGL